MLEALDKYKFGILASVVTMMLIYMYLQMDHYVSFVKVEVEPETIVEIPEEDIELHPENIMVPDFNPEEVTNAVRDLNYDGPTTTDYSNYTSPEQVEQSLRELEQQMLDEAGGAEDRARIRAQMDARIEREKEEFRKSQQNNNQPSQSGSDGAPPGSVMVEWDLEQRKPHQNNKWYVRNPGYTCGRGASGRVAIDIKVDNGGRVVSVTHNTARSTGANPCMIEQALKYAKMSRFNYSPGAPKSQGGVIYYTFASQ